MKKSLLAIAILILNLSVSAQVVSKFSWDGALAPATKAEQGPDAASVSPGALRSILRLIDGFTNGAINPGPAAKDVDLTLPNSSYFNIPSMDVSVDFRREETEASFFTRGSLFDFGMSGGKLFVKFNVENGMGGNTTVNSGMIYTIPDDHTFHNYRFMYDNSTGIANLWADGVVKYTYAGTGGRNLYWTGAGSPVIGKMMDATGRNVAVLDNFEMRNIPAAIILPVKFTSFTTAAKTSGVILKWSTVNEDKVKNFVVERSFDGLAFEAIKSVQAKGSAISNDYEAMDVLSNKNVSYRIRSVDMDGKAGYSVIRTVTAGTTNVSAEISAYPNPATTSVNLKFNANESADYTYSVYTQDGRKIQTASQSVEKGLATITVQLSQNAPHNSVLLIVVENHQSNSKETLRIIHK